MNKELLWEQLARVAEEYKIFLRTHFNSKVARKINEANKRNNKGMRMIGSVR